SLLVQSTTRAAAVAAGHAAGAVPAAVAHLATEVSRAMFLSTFRVSLLALPAALVLGAAGVVALAGPAAPPAPSTVPASLPPAPPAPAAAGAGRREHAPAPPPRGPGGPAGPRRAGLEGRVPQGLRPRRRPGDQASARPVPRLPQGLHGHPPRRAVARPLRVGR